jgi:hypothetical protein
VLDPGPSGTQGLNGIPSLFLTLPPCAWVGDMKFHCPRYHKIMISSTLTVLCCPGLVTHAPVHDDEPPARSPAYAAAMALNILFNGDAENPLSPGQQLIENKPTRRPEVQVWDRPMSR